MANLTLFDPFGFLRGDPFTVLLEMQSDMVRLFGQFLGTVSTPAATEEWKPMIETFKKGENLIIKCELPGVEPGDVDVSIDELTNQLVIRGERKQDKATKSEEYIRQGLSYGRFALLFPIPQAIKSDLMKAKYNNGMLEITVPTAATPKPRKIRIETAPGAPEVEKAEKKAA